MKIIPALLAVNSTDSSVFTGIATHFATWNSSVQSYLSDWLFSSL